MTNKVHGCNVFSLRITEKKTGPVTCNLKGGGWFNPPVYCISQMYISGLPWTGQVIRTNCDATVCWLEDETTESSCGMCWIFYCRNKTGILGWRSEKTETVNGYEAKVEYGAAQTARWSLTERRVNHWSRSSVWYFLKVHFTQRA